MAAKHELEIEINAMGDVNVKVKGAKGKQCLQYVELFKSIGEIKDTQVTSEIYEPEPGVQLTNNTKSLLK
ncbi:MAG: DUF2997 domain-containing protein [Armatimonadota bacterium]